MQKLKHYSKDFENNNAFCSFNYRYHTQNFHLEFPKISYLYL